VVGHFADADKALARGEYRVAAAELESTLRALELQPDALHPRDSRQVMQLYHEATLLAGLLPESLEEIVGHAASSSDPNGRDWQAHFAERYQGKPVMLDTEIWTTADGAYEVEFRPSAGRLPARINLEDFALLKTLRPAPGKRVVFLGRLASITLEQEEWVVRFEPASGVLLTHPGAAKAGAQHEDVLPILRQQASFLQMSP
jgi:hypothetical protein